MTIATVSFNELDLAAAQAALDNSRVASWFAGAINTNAAVWTNDAENPSEFDGNGNFTGNVAGRVLRFEAPKGILAIAKQALNDASVPYEITEIVRQSRVEAPEGQANPQLNTATRRLPGYKWEAYATILADGTKAAQSVGTNGKILDQWTDGRGVISMQKVDDNTIAVITPGDYAIDARFNWDPQATPGVTWEFGILIDKTPFAKTITDDDGRAVVRGQSIGTLSAGQELEIAVAHDQATAQTFKLLDGSGVRFYRAL